MIVSCSMLSLWENHRSSACLAIYSWRRELCCCGNTYSGISLVRRKNERNIRNWHYGWYDESSMPSRCRKHYGVNGLSVVSVSSEAEWDHCTGLRRRDGRNSAILLKNMSSYSDTSLLGILLLPGMNLKDCFTESDVAQTDSYCLAEYDIANSIGLIRRQ